MLKKKNPFGQNKRYKKCLVFLLRAPTHHNFTFNLRFLYELKHKRHLSKTVCGIFHFRFPFVLLRFIFLLNKMHDFFTLKLHNSFQNYNNRKATHSFSSRPLLFKLQQEAFTLSTVH